MRAWLGCYADVALPVRPSGPFLTNEFGSPVTDRKASIDLLGAVLLVGFALLMGLNQVMVKVVNTGIAPVFQVALRSLCAFFPILIFALLMRRRLSLSDGSLIPGIVSGLFFALEFVLMFTALEYTTVTRAALFFYCMPFWVALGAHFLIPGERLSMWRVAGLLLAIAGVALALSHSDSPTGDKAFIGDLMCLAGSVFWAGIALLARTTKLSKSTPEMQLLYQLAISALVLLPFASMFGEPIRELTPFIAFLFAVQVLLVVCVGFLTWFWVLSIYPASDMASFTFLTPLFGMTLGWLLLDEAVTWNLLVAMVLVAIGIVLVNRRPAT